MGDVSSLFGRSVGRLQRRVAVARAAVGRTGHMISEWKIQDAAQRAASKVAVRNPILRCVAVVNQLVGGYVDCGNTCGVEVRCLKIDAWHTAWCVGRSAAGARVAY